MTSDQDRLRPIEDLGSFLYKFWSHFFRKKIRTVFEEGRENLFAQIFEKNDFFSSACLWLLLFLQFNDTICGLSKFKYMHNFKFLALLVSKLPKGQIDNELSL